MGTWSRPCSTQHRRDSDWTWRRGLPRFPLGRVAQRVPSTHKPGRREKPPLSEPRLPTALREALPLGQSLLPRLRECRVTAALDSCTHSPRTRGRLPLPTSSSSPRSGWHHPPLGVQAQSLCHTGVGPAPASAHIPLVSTSTADPQPGRLCPGRWLHMRIAWVIDM